MNADTMIVKQDETLAQADTMVVKQDETLARASEAPLEETLESPRVGPSIMDVLLPATPPKPVNARVIRRLNLAE